LFKNETEFLITILNVMDKIWKQYEELRKESNLTYSREHRCYFAGTREDADFFFRSENMTVDYPFRSTRQVFGKTMLDSDDEKFTATKKVIAAYFSVKAVKHYEEYFLNRIITRVLAEAAVGKQQQIDVERAISSRIPVLAILEIYGIDASYEAFTFERLDTLINYIDDPTNSLEVANRCRLEIYDLLEKCMSGSIPVNPAGMLARLDPSAFENRDDLLSTLTMLLTAGMATTVAGFNSLIVHLYSSRDRAMENRHNEKWIREFVDETLREYPPLHSTVRFVRSPFVYKDTPLKKNDTVTIVMASANKDRCPAGEEKRPAGNYSFGKGKHACLGIQLAQSELVLFLKQFIPCLEQYTLNAHIDDPMTGRSVKTFSNLTLIPVEHGKTDH
jgi:cytochrome P450